MDTIDEILESIDEGDIKKMNILFKKGVDINAQNSDGETALHHASYEHNIKIMNILFKKGADPNAQNSDGSTPLHYGYGDVNTIKLLISHGARINARDNQGRTPLHSACYSGTDIGAISILISHGADVNADDKKGRTPLKIVDEVFDSEYEEYLVELSRLLIRSGATVPTKFKNSVLNTLFNYKSEQFFKNYEPRTDCTICLQPLSDQDQPVPVCISLNCQHGFHCECINEWLNNGKDTCPYCRKPFDLITLNTVDQEKLKNMGFGKRKYRKRKVRRSLTLKQVNKLIRELKNM